MPYDPIPETVRDAVRMWDAGDSVFTVEMGGLGPGYEQCIQVLAFEIMREFMDDEDLPLLFGLLDDDERQDAAWANTQRRRDEVYSRLPEPYTGMTGAQVGAATSLALSVLRRGYREVLRDDAVKDRLIQASNGFNGMAMAQLESPSPRELLEDTENRAPRKVTTRDRS